MATTKLEKRWLAAIMALAVLLRLATAVWLGDTIEGAQQVRVFDQHSYNALAQALLAGRGYTFERAWYPGFTPANTPTAHWSFLYPLYLAGVYAISGFHPLAARLIQALIVGLLETWLVYRLGQALFNETVGVVAAGMSAVYLYFIFYDATLMTEPFFICAVLAMLLLGLRISGMAKDLTSPLQGRGVETQTTARHLKGRGEWAALGLAAGVGALLRQTVLFWLPVELVWIFWAGRKSWGGWKRPLVGALVTLGIAALVVLPWTARNYVVYRAFLPLNSNAGYAFYSANHPNHGVHFDQDYVAPLPEDLRGLGLNEAQWATALTKRGLAFIVQDPLRYLRLTLSKSGVQFGFWFLPESTLASNLLRVLSFGVYLPLFIAGLALSGRDWRRNSLIYLFVIVFNLLHILTWAGNRYRLPVDAALMPFAALAVYTAYLKIAAVGYNRGEGRGG
jgi:hypothetical protein